MLILFCENVFLGNFCEIKLFICIDGNCMSFFLEELFEFVFEELDGVVLEVMWNILLVVIVYLLLL